MFRFLVKFFYHVKVISHTSRYVQDFFSQQEIVVLWQTSSQQVLPCPSPFFFLTSDVLKQKNPLIINIGKPRVVRSRETWGQL